MDNFKIEFEAYEVRELGEMLRDILAIHLASELGGRLLLEIMILGEFYKKQSEKFMFINRCKLTLKPYQAIALNRVVSELFATKMIAYKIMSAIEPHFLSEAKRVTATKLLK